MDTPAPITTGNATIDKIILVALSLVPLCSALSHIVPPTTLAGKVISWIALNGGKLLVKP